MAGKKSSAEEKSQKSRVRLLLLHFLAFCFGQSAHAAEQGVLDLALSRGLPIPPRKRIEVDLSVYGLLGVMKALAGCCTRTQNGADLPRRFQLRARFEAQAAPRKLGRFSTTMVPASLL